MRKNGMKWIRETYNVPARRGARVLFQPDIPGHPPKPGVVTSCIRGDLRLKFDGDKKTYPAFFHPTYNLKWETHPNGCSTN